MTARIVMPDGDLLCERLFNAPHRKKALDLLGGAQIYTDAPITDPQVVVERCKGAEFVIFGWPLPNQVLELPGMRMATFMGTGAANYVDLGLARQQGITICNAPGYGDAAVAEHTLALILAGLRRITYYHNELAEGRWVEALPALELSTATVGLIGFGGIARHLTDLLQAFGSRVLVHVRNPERWKLQYPSIEFVELDELFSESDVVSLHLGFKEELRASIGAKQFSQMQDGALFVNTARAELVVENDLLDALRSERIHAALDVFNQEPLPSDHAYIGIPGLTLTPHVAFNTPAAMERMADLIVKNIVRAAEGTPVNVVS